jgi:hypothetical protein
MACTRVIVTSAIHYRTRALRCRENPAYLRADFERADERTRTAYPCSSYEFAKARSSPYLCVR